LLRWLLAATLAGCTLPPIDIAADDAQDGPPDDTGADVVTVGDAPDIAPIDASDVVADASNDAQDAADVAPSDAGCAPGTCNAVSVAVRGTHACAIRMTPAGNIVQCWGAGYLGDGTRSGGRSSPVTVQGLPSGDQPAEVAAGTDFTCVRLVSGSVYCWGGNAVGQLGDGTTTSRLLPVQVQGTSAFFASRIAAGDDYAVAIPTLAARVSNTVAFWGHDIATATTVAIPHASGVSGANCDAWSLAAGSAHACAYLNCPMAINRGIYCWGSNSYAESSGSAADGTPVPAGGPGNVNVALPAAVATAQLVIAGSHDTYVVSPDTLFNLWGWGQQSVLQLGSASPGTYGSMNAVLINRHIAIASAGNDFACAAYTSPAQVVCWGTDSMGQLGDTMTGGSSAMGSPLLASMTVTGLSAGTTNTCAIANGDVYCWGSSNSGESGVPRSTTPVAPTRIVFP
jgi:alpha-tubulin suppressor-like RCC1 family protein